MREMMRRFRLWLRRDAEARELEEEIRFHLEESARAQAAQGAPPSESERRARKRFGNVTRVREESRDAWSFALLEGLWRDLGYGARQLWRNPVFAGASALSLSLGIGAVVTVFALVDAVILRKLPVEQPDRLVMFENPGFSVPILAEVGRRAEALEGLFGWSNERLTVDWGDQAENVAGLLVLGPYYDTAGVRAQIGRLLSSDDDQGRAGRAAVISHASWTTRFGADPDVLGRGIRIDGAAYTIVGVTPPGFFGLSPGFDPEVTISAATLPMRHPGASDLMSPTRAWLHLMARLAPGVSLEQAQAELRVYWPRVMGTVTPTDMPPERRQRYLDRRTALLPGATGFSSVRQRFKEALWLLFGLAGLLFGAACASAANLMLARMTERRRELAVRTAIGAGRGRVLRQVLAEGGLIGALGAAGGLVVGALASRAVVRLLSTSDAPIHLVLEPDLHVLGFAALAAALSVVVCVLVPALRATGDDPRDTLQEKRVGGGRRRKMSAPVVAGQVAVSVVLLAGCGLFLRSLEHVQGLEAGFEREGLIVGWLDPLATGRRGPQLVSWYDEIVRRVAALPGIESVSLSWTPPISNEMGSWTQHTAIDGAEPESGESAVTYFNIVSPGYFATVGTRLLEGRDFSNLDSIGAAPAVVINEPLARAYFPGESALGRSITIGTSDKRRNLTIIGVVQGSAYQYLQEPERRIAYMPLAQHEEMTSASNLTLEVRAQGEASAALAAVSETIRAMDAATPFRLETMDDRIAESLVREIALARLATALGVLSLALAVAGLYGLLAYTVVQRTNEIGVRMALGATQGRMLRLVLRDAGRIAAFGLAAGVLLFLGGARFAAGLLHGIEPADAGSIAGASALVLATALAAAAWPARTAARVSPAVAIRHE